MHNLKEIKVWRKAIDLAATLYELVSRFPSEEKYGLSAQMKRSSVSIASNIAEGAGRNSKKEFIQFLGFANGSSFELLTQVAIACKLGLLDAETAKEVSFKIIEIQKMIYGFQKKLKKD